MLKHIADTIDLSITEAQIKWFVKMLKQVSAAPVIYTGEIQSSLEQSDWSRVGSCIVRCLQASSLGDLGYDWHATTTIL